MGHENGLVTINVTGTDAGVLAGARDRFGNRRANYGEALRRHYADDPPEGWAHTVPHLMPLTDLADHAEAAGLAMHEEPPSDWDTYTGAGGTRLVQIAGCLGMAFDDVSPRSASTIPVRSSRMERCARSWPSSTCGCRPAH